MTTPFFREERKDGYIIEIFQEESFPSPREYYANAGVLVQNANNYVTSAQFGDELLDERDFALRLLALGIPLKEISAETGLELEDVDTDTVASEQVFAYKWVVWSGDKYFVQVSTDTQYRYANGIIYLSQAKAQEEGISTVAEAESNLQSEIDTLSMWHNKQVYYYCVLDAFGNVVDTCGGIFDDSCPINEESYVYKVATESIPSPQPLPVTLNFDGLSVWVSNDEIGVFIQREDGVHRQVKAFSANNDWVVGSPLAYAVGSALIEFAANKGKQ